jgi:hypothetical protein
MNKPQYLRLLEDLVCKKKVTTESIRQTYWVEKPNSLIKSIRKLGVTVYTVPLGNNNFEYTLKEPK